MRKMPREWLHRQLLHYLRPRLLGWQLLLQLEDRLPTLRPRLQRPHLLLLRLPHLLLLRLRPRLLGWQPMFLLEYRLPTRPRRCLCSPLKRRPITPQMSRQLTMMWTLTR